MEDAESKELKKELKRKIRLERDRIRRAEKRLKKIEPVKIETVKFEIQQVGKKYNNKKVTYRSVLYNKYGWADSLEFLPLEYDMCTLKTQRGKISGWHTGSSWVGLKLKKTDRVIAWKLDLILFKSIRDFKKG